MSPLLLAFLPICNAAALDEGASGEGSSLDELVARELASATPAAARSVRLGVGMPWSGQLSWRLERGRKTLEVSLSERGSWGAPSFGRMGAAVTLLRSGGFDLAQSIYRGIGIGVTGEGEGMWGDGRLHPAAHLYLIEGYELSRGGLTRIYGEAKLDISSDPLFGDPDRGYVSLMFEVGVILNVDGRERGSSRAR